MQYGLLGEHLSHSYSKIIHEQLTNKPYELISLHAEEFATFMQDMPMQGINVTIPYKEAVIPYLHFCDEKAKAIHAVNTIVKKADGLYGYNTDYDGFLYTLQKHRISVKNKKVLVIGNGGAAKAIHAVLQDEQAKTIVHMQRTITKETCTYEEAKKEHFDAEIIVNTSPCGMFPNIEPSPVQLQDFPFCKTVIDIIYNPLRTSLCLEAKKYKIPYYNGLDMLVAQAVKAAEIFHEQTFPDTVIDTIVQELTVQKRNIVLIGMPSCAKSTLGKMLAEVTHMPFYDLDQCLEETYGSPIKDIIHTKGEAYFRTLEKAIVKKYATYNGVILATGGGVVLDPENIKWLSHYGMILYIKRDLQHLLVSDDRPLSSSKQAIATLYQQRKELYEKASDRIIENNTTLTDALEAICEALKQFPF